MNACSQGTRTLTILLGLITAACWLSPARAAETAQNPHSTAKSAKPEKYDFDIPSGEARDTLLEFYTQADLNGLYGYTEVKGIITRRLKGRYTIAQGLLRLTAATPLRAHFIDDRTFTLSVDGAPDAQGPVSAQMPGGAGAPKSDRRSIVSPPEGRVVIRATRNTPMIEQMGSPTLTFDRAYIEATGLTTVQDFLRTMPQVFGGGPTEDTREIGFEAHTNAGRGAGVNLRGLGAGSTLVLLNGHRVAAGGSQGIFVDVSSIPLSAIERIEILPDNSSTRFGADAVGGVVNFVLMESFAGARTEAYFGSATRGYLDENRLAQVLGIKSKAFDGLVIFDYYARDNLPAADRSLARSDLREFGGSNFDTPQGNPGTLMVGGVPYAIPSGQDGRDLDVSKLGVPALNLEDKYERVDLLPTQQRWSIYATGNKTLNPTARLFGDAFYSERDTHGLGGGFRTTLPVPATNAFTPTRVPVDSSGAPVPVLVAYNFADDLGPLRSSAEIRTLNLVGGLEWDVGQSWQITGTGNLASEHLDSLLENSVDPTALFAALADDDPATAFNPFGDGSHTNPATLESVRRNLPFGTKSTLWSANVTATGKLFYMPGGRTELSTGVDYRKQAFQSSTAQPFAVQSAESKRRTIRAAFASLSLPLFGSDNRHVALEELSLSVGGRYEGYSDFGRIFTPRLGMQWVPAHGLALRGTWSRSFRPPNLMDLDESNNFLNLSPVADPTSPTGQSVALVRSGKNAALREETAKSWTVGVDLELPVVPDLSLAFTYFNIDFTDRMNAPASAADLLVNPATADLVTRNPPPEQIQALCDSTRFFGPADACTTVPVSAIIDLRVRNSAFVRTNGIDMLGQYVLYPGRDIVTLGLNGTYVLSFTNADAKQVPAVERVSTQNNPVDLRLLGSIDWVHRGFHANAYATYYDNYRDIASVPQKRVKSWTTLGLTLAYTTKAPFGSSRQSGTTFSLIAENLFDEDPPFLNNPIGIGYDQENGDLTGRMVGLTVRRTW